MDCFSILLIMVIKMIKNELLSKNIKKAIFKNMMFYFISASVFFISSGSIYVLRGWFLYTLLISGALYNNYILLKNNPEVLEARADQGAETQNWDKTILFIYFITHTIFIPLLAGLDAVRFEWSNLPLFYLFIGIILYLLSLFIISRAMLANKYFEGTVRIQTDRNQRVIDKGPYQYIRHPGNLGMILTAFVPPLIIGSAYALILSFFLAIIIIIRTNKEDQLLQAELEGYIDYCERVKYRLIPLIW